MADTTPKPIAPEVLARLVALPHSALPDVGCVAWMEAADRRCSKDRTEGYLCKRHHTVALKRVPKALAKIEQDEARSQAAAERRAERAPKLRERLAKIDAEIAHRTRERTTDMAVINTPLRTRLSDSQIARVAQLYRDREAIVRQLGEPAA